jgi:hypothetical protein
MKRVLTSALAILMATHHLYANYQIIDSSFGDNIQFINDTDLKTASTSEGTSHHLIIDQLKPYAVTSISVNFKKEAIASEYSITFGEDPKDFGLISKSGPINSQTTKIDLGNKGVGGRYIQLVFKSKKAISISDIHLNLLQKNIYGYSSKQGFKQARSVHMGFRKPPADAIYIEAKPVLAPNGTYFCQLGFSGGYLGIQKLGDGKKICIFSIWDGSSNNSQHTDKELRANAIFARKGVQVRRFGGEGSGIKSMMPYNWKLNEYSAYIVTVSPTDQPNRHIYTAFLQDPETKEWFRMASFNAIGKNKLVGIYSFVEDFKRDYNSYNLGHKSYYRNPWYFSKSENKWYPITNLCFTADSAVSVNINAQLHGPEASLATGGKVANKQKISKRVTNEQISQNLPAIGFDLFPKK